MNPPSLPAPWLRLVSTSIPALARDIVDAIFDEVPDYRTVASPTVRARAQRIVAEALHSYTRWMSGPPNVRPVSPTAPLIDTFRDLGRSAALAGRSHDALQTAYRISSRIVVRRLLEWEREIPIQAERAADLSASLFAFVDELADLSAQGYADALGEGPSVDRERARLLTMVLDPRGFASPVVAARAHRVHWNVPDVACLVDVIGLPDGRGEPALGRLGQYLLGNGVLAGRAMGRDLLVTPTPPKVDELAERLETREPGAVLIVGYHVPIQQLAGSLRWVRRLASLRERGCTGDEIVMTCESYSLALMQDAGRDVLDQLVARRLEPLAMLSPGKRVKYGRLLSAWLEIGGLRGEAPGILDKHRQTLRYQVARLEQLFGDQLADRESRLELMLALRTALPEWEKAASLARP